MVLPGADEVQDVDALASAQFGRLAFELAVGAGDRHPLAGAHPQQVNLEFGERGQDVEEHPAHRIGGVIDGAADREPHAASGQRVADCSRVGHRARQPVELRDNQRVALADRGQRPLETGSATVAAGHAVIEIDAVVADPNHAQRVALGSKVLLVGRAAGVADQNAGIGRRSAPDVGAVIFAARSGSGLGRRAGRPWLG